MCKLLHVTPKELGEKRRKDPLGVAFLERHLLWRIEQEAKARKEYERKLQQQKHMKKH